MNDRELTAYLAGLFDAEGSIFIEKKKPYGDNRTTRYVLAVTIANTRLELVEIAHKRYGGSLVGPVQQKKQNQRPFFIWKLSGPMARDFLKEVEPYLIVKREKLTLAYALQDRIESYTHKPVAEDELRAREEIYQRFRRLNRRGVTEECED